MLCPTANENSAQDVGAAIRNINRIKNSFNAHFCIIHHTGKENNGSRGSSALPSAVDTEIEVKASIKKSSCTIRKQRDLGTKGQSFKFTLEDVKIGENDWGKEMTTCIVKEEEQDLCKPTKINSPKKFSPIAAKIICELEGKPWELRKIDVRDILVKKTSHAGSSIYRSIIKLIENGHVQQEPGKIEKNVEAKLALTAEGAAINEGVPHRKEVTGD